MQRWEYLTIAITIGKDETVESVNRGPETIFRNVEWSIVRQYIHRLGEDGWQITDKYAVESGENYEFKRLIV